MKHLFRLLLIGILIISCSKDEIVESQDITNITPKPLKSVTYTTEGGSTSFSNPSLSSKSNVGDLFISQFPLIEQVQNYERTIDSLGIVIDSTLTSTTINPYVNRKIDSTIIQDFYIGGSAETVEKGLYINFEYLGKWDSIQRADGDLDDIVFEDGTRGYFLRNFVSNNFGETLDPNGNSNNEYFVKDMEIIEDIIPIFDENGIEIDAKDGLKFKIKFETNIVDNFEFIITVYEYWKPGYGPYVDAFGFSDPDWVIYRDGFVNGDSKDVIKASQKFEIRFTQ